MLILPEKIRIRLIELITAEPNVKRAILFGSRARGDARPNSDIDIALVGAGIPLSLNTRLRDSVGLYKLDIVRMDDLENEELRANIEQDGEIIFERED
jgi:predicted nucleotidyltransferase